MSYKEVDRSRLREFDKMKRKETRTRESIREELKEEGSGDHYAGYVVKRYLSHDLPGGGITPQEQEYIKENFRLLRSRIQNPDKQKSALKHYAHLLTLTDLTELAHEYGSDGRVMAVRPTIIGGILNYVRQENPNDAKLKKIAHLLSSEEARNALAHGENVDQRKVKAHYLLDLAAKNTENPEAFYGVCKEMAKKPEEKTRQGNLTLAERVHLVAAVGALALGIFFLLPSITGNAIASDIGKKVSMVGATFIILGLISSYLYVQSHKTSKKK